VELEPISTAGAPAPGGHYTQGVGYGDLIFVSGQLPVPLEGSASFDEQAKQALASLLAVIEAGGGSASTTLKVTAYIVGIENWPRFNKIYAEIFGDAKPARAVVPVPELHYGYLVEVDAVAVRSGRGA
jgi:reactive intermediate/imine deaminase